MSVRKQRETSPNGFEHAEAWEMNIPVKPDYSVEWLPPVSKAGDYVEIRAEMDVVVVMSACPQDIVPINDLNPVEVTFSVHA